MPPKSTKDTNAPKKALTAYILFSASERPKLKASGLDNFAEMNRALGSAWKQADQKTRAHYEKEHEREKVRYENELKNYQKSGQPAPSSRAAQKSSAPSKVAPAKPTSKTPPKPAAKKNAPAAKSAKPQSDEDEDDDDDDDEKENVEKDEEEDEDEDDDDEEESDEESEEEEEKPAPPAKSSRKKN